MSLVEKLKPKLLTTRLVELSINQIKSSNPYKHSCLQRDKRKSTDNPSNVERKMRGEGARLRVKTLLRFLISSGQHEQ